MLDGRYRVIEAVAEGAMGIVYRAERVRLGRVVAVKVLHESLPNELSSRKRFEIEAMAMAKLEHPHCAAVVDVGLHDDRPFVVMDFVSGQNLKEVITAEAPIPIARAVELLRQILSGLAHAHEHGIIHRDIKPANIVLSQKAGLGDHVKILDFGLARLGHDSSLTTGIVVGTPSYMAPEQIRGVPIDGRVDIYACGIVLFELLTGTKPFVSLADDPIEVCTMHLKAPPPRLADKLPGVDFGPLEAIVARALAKAADERFANAVEFAAAIEAAVPRRSLITPVAGVPIDPRAIEPRPTAEYAGVAMLARVTPPPIAVRTLPMPMTGGPNASHVPRTPPPPPVPAQSSPNDSVVSASSLMEIEAPPPPPPATPSQQLAAVRPPPPPRTDRWRATDAWRAIAPKLARGRMLGIIGGVVAALAILVIAVVAATGDSEPAAAPDASGSAAAPAGSAPPPAAGSDDEIVAADAPDRAGDVIARGDQALASRRFDEALRLGFGGRRLFPSDARFPKLIGRVSFERLHFSEGLVMFREAIRLDPTLRSDPDLIKSVLRGFITTPRPDYSLSMFMREEIGPAARPYLQEAAREHPNQSVRQRAAYELRYYR